MNIPLLNESDKFFWHDYIPFYESFFNNFYPEKILELGVANGNSVRYLLNRFPKATILGADIITRTPAWPIDSRFSTYQIDQGDVTKVAQFFSSNKFDLIIEDGSHHPIHQVNCLVHGINSVNPGGIYILEDIHTSHPLSSYYVSKAPLKQFFSKFRKAPKGNALSVLLAINHFHRISTEIDDVRAEQISNNSIISKSQVLNLSKKIKRISLYRRSHLPDKCICGSTDYSFSSYKCICGNPIFSDTDSMTFVIECN